MNIVASQEMHTYFDSLGSYLKKAYEVANLARKKGIDPEDKVDIILTRDMAERVEGLISVVAPMLVGTGITKRIRELEKKYKPLDWRVALQIAEEVAKQKFCKFDTKKQAIETGIRTGFAYHTLGIVSAPLEGFIEIDIKKRIDGKEYIAAKYAGPIRGAGGTGAAVSVIIVDYIRKKLGYETYDASEAEINRYITELDDYHDRVTNLQYKPSEEEIKHLIANMPVEVDGEPTEKIEVSNYKDLPRVQTNLIRGGVCLVVSMIALKAPKLWKEISKWGKDFDLEWGFLEHFLDIQKKKKAGGATKKSKAKISPDYTYISDLVAGRPVLTYPLRPGGFRLRYGRARTSGFSAASIHPALMHCLNNYIAIGTQLKLERPGKAAAITTCDSIEGPLVKLDDGSVVYVDDERIAREIKNKIVEIVYMGDILICYGDFYDRAHSLVPAGYCEEWWLMELEKAVVDLFGALDFDKLAELFDWPVDQLNEAFKNPLRIDPRLAVEISRKLKVPLHPRYTYYWNLISLQDFFLLLGWLKKMRVVVENNQVHKIILPLQPEPKRVLEILGVPHITAANEYVVIQRDCALPFLASLNIETIMDIDALRNGLAEEDKPLDIVNRISEIRIMDKGGTFIGARMGRPEKAKTRELIGSPQVLFPVGEEGGRLRCFQSALEAGKIKADFPTYHCDKCSKDTIFPVCESCDSRTRKMYYCKICGFIDKQMCQKHGKAASYIAKELNINYYFEKTLERLGTKAYPDLIKGVRGTSNKDHIPENLIKGVLRAKHGIYVNKDGTTRYDMTELPMTHFKPKEISTSIEKLIELGYTHDILNRPLENKNQTLEIKPQDVILPGVSETKSLPADEVIFNVSKFVDELLEKAYGQPPFYNLKSKEELVGHLVIGLAPHISAGTVGRIIGFSEVQACFAHPLWHAAIRRDCDGDENCVILLMDGLLNFSRQFLPDKRGGRTMDSPLVLTSILQPAEVDDMVHKLDVVFRYPLEFYQACLEYKNPWDVEIELLGHRLGTENQYEKIGFTNDTKNINAGVKCSAYKLLPSMEEKLKGQLDIAQKIRAVDTSGVATLVIEKHLLRDIKGNLRKFSMQQFRCVKCNEKFRRVPLIGKCTKCGGKLIFTVSEGSVVKYLEPCISLGNKYDVPTYLKQSLELLKRRVEGVFGKEKEKQEGLGKWFG